MGNKQTEQSAIEHVMALERAAGREPKDVHTTGLPFDVDSPPRKIEVKAFSRSARSEVLPLENRQVTEAKADPDHYYVYVVDNLAGSDGAEVGVRILHGDVLLAMIKRSRPQITYWPTLKAAEYDQAEQLR
ncbi:protein NO VEIN domain-containing protein [Streptomyces sp. NPDC096354]|uniref:protein NO VEIN domain-containing protein n=1 Tax=Streptomyces sp. NPDC096354 TaxID=3366088 RepID=UPI0037FD13EC